MKDKPTRKAPYPIRLNKHGGKRKGSGRKPKYNEPTKTISFRCPISKEIQIKQAIKTILAP